VKSGIRSFVTTKIDWSMITTFPYTTFLWEGADGSRILGMMPPLNYNGNLIPSECRKQWKLIRQKNLLEEIPFSFGWGDGGGGPTQEMIENGRRLGNLAGVPQCRFGTLTEYYQELHEKLEHRPLPVWNGELYLELHRACQITQARTKRNNRKMELLLRETEWFATQGHLRGGGYPSEELLAVWEEVLTAQFHDILPGSGTEPVYQEADEVYARVEESTRALLSKAVSRHARSIDTRGKGSPVLLFNSLSWDRNDPVCLDMEAGEEADLAFEDTEGHSLASQRSVSLEGTPQVWIDSPTVPSHGHTVIRRVSGGNLENRTGGLKVTASGMENEYFNLRFDRRGQIVSILDKRYGREVLAEGGIGNELQLFHDRPHMHDAWDYDFNVDENRWTWDQVESFKVVEEGPVRCSVEVRRQTEFSTLVQRVVLYRNLARIDFETMIDWWEKHVLLKAAFPVAVRSSRATYEIQFATIERATHNNTPFDRARFEVAHHRWLDLSEGDYGVTLANDCKYGSDVQDNVIRLSLLRASTSPDPHADEGRHKMIYSLIPHGGDWREGESVRRAYELNAPTRAVATSRHDGDLPATYSMVRCDRGNVVVETVKKEEDGDGVVLRVYEAEGCRGEVNLTLAFEIQGAEETDLMERNPRKARHTRNTLRFDIAPYEIKTFRLSPKN
jgi:alpha-mannosidase